MNNPIWTDKDLGVVSAFGVAKENGWTGTEAEWEALQAAAPQKASDAEAYAAGTRSGTEVESDDPAYHNNAAYYAEQAKESETAAAGSATSAAASAADALEHTQGVIETWLENNIDPETGYVLDRDLALQSAAAPADMVGDLKSALSDYSNYIGTISVMDGYGVSEYYQKIVASSGSKCVYFAVQPNTLYRINKTVITSRFVIGATESTPTSNVATTKIVRNDSATSIEFTTGESDQYICVMVYSSSDSMSWSSVLESISVKINSANDRNARARIGIAENKLDDLITEITPIITNGYFVSNTGSYSSNSSFMVTEPFKVYRNTKLFVYARGYSQNVAIISRVDVNKIKYVPKVICPDGTARTYEFVVTESGYYAISGNKDTTFVIYAVPYSANDTQINLAMFQKFGVIGDSYASGVVFSDNSTSYTKYECSWGQIIARDCGTQCTNYSEGGLSTRTWLTDTDHGLQFLLNSDPEDIYYLALGINDYYLLGEDYLGTEADIEDEEADTFYGNYGKIIRAIQTHAPKAKLIMLTCSNTNEVPQMFNDAIIRIAIHFSIPYIIQADDEYFQSREYTAMVGGHPTAVGYAGMAEAFKRLISDAVKDNYYYFWKMYAYGT